MIVRFTNVTRVFDTQDRRRPRKVVGHTTNIRYGIIVDTDPGGMVQVEWDFWPWLMDEVEANLSSGVADTDDNAVQHTGWIRLDKCALNGSTMEVLPISTKVKWVNDQRLSRREIAQGRSEPKQKMEVIQASVRSSERSRLGAGQTVWTNLEQAKAPVEVEAVA